MSDYLDDKSPEELSDILDDVLIEDEPKPARVVAPARPVPRTLRELMEHPELLEPPPAIIPNLVYAGRVTLLSAREKTGKSTLLAQAIAAATWGMTFLGEYTQPSTVLWYAIDEPLGDAVRRFLAYGAHMDELHIQDVRPTAEQMRAEIQATGANLVVIDTLTELWAGAIESDRSAEDVALFLRPFVNVSRETGAALALAHHTRKDGTEYRGSVQLGATVDVVLTLRRPGMGSEPGAEDEDDSAGEDDGRRTLRGKGRGGVAVNLRICYDGTQYSIGEAPLPLNLRILRLLEEGVASGTAIASRLRVRKQDALDELREMKDGGMVEYTGRGYLLTPNGRRVLGGMSESGSATGSRPPIETPPGTGAGTGISDEAKRGGTELTPSERGRNRSEPPKGTQSGRPVPEPLHLVSESGTGVDAHLTPEQQAKRLTLLSRNAARNGAGTWVP